MRSLVFFAFISASLTAVSGFAQTVRGRVIDPSGRPLPRAYVHTIASDQSSTIGVFTDSDGRFILAAPAGNCTIEVTLTGFEGATAPCSDRPLDVKLALAPVSEHVVVSATRTEMPAGEVGNSVSVFDIGDLERRQFPLVADVLLGSPGVAVEGTGAPGGVTSVYVRGGESNYNKVLLDGIPLNEPGGTFNFNNVSSENLEHIEIVRGAQSALFGSDAMSSVIHLVTARARPGTPVQGSVTAEGGSFGTGRLTGTVRGAGERNDYSLGIAHYTTNNEVPNNEFRNTTVSGSGGAQLTTTAALRAVFRGEFGKSGVPGQTAFGRPDLDAFFDRRDIVGGVTFSQEISPKLRHQATYGLASTRQQSTNLLLDEPYTPEFDGHVSPFEFFDFAYDSRSYLHRHYASYQADWFPTQGDTVGTQHVTVAADWDGERGTLRDALAGDDTKASRDNIGVTVQHQALWRNVSVSAGARFEHNDSFGNAAVPRASIAIVAHRSNGAIGQTRLKASAGTGIKEPTLLQSFSRNTFFLGNPDLEPERSRTIDAGIEQRFAEDRVKLDLTWFDNHYRNIISTRTLSFNPFRSQYFNIGESKARGLELTGEVAPAARLHARFGYTLTASEVTDSEAAEDTIFAVGNWLFRRPRHAGFAEVSWTDRRVSLNLFGSIVGQRVDSDFSSLIPPLTVNDGHTRWDVRASYHLSRGLALTAAIDNLADAEYMEPLGYPALGRAVRVGIRAGF
jgi:vitamin B12 transporter